MNKKELLEWYGAAGVDEAIDESPVNHYVEQPAAAIAPDAPVETPLTKVAPPASLLQFSPAAAADASRKLADGCMTLEALEAAVRAFDGCAIKKTASKTVFSDGNPQARIMIIGEAPGAQEDLQGIPFCGPSGQLLDRMLAAIGLDRKTVYISNTVFWRPPGNRQPTAEENAICLPLVEKHIALVRPQLLILSGGTATTTLLQRDQSISRLRGKLYEYQNVYLDSPIATAVTYHPSYLLRSPAQKKLAWSDLLMIKNSIDTLT